MVRSKSQSSVNNGKSPSKKSRKSESSDNSSENDVNIRDSNQSRSTVHKQNLYIVSFPVILLFNVLRSVLYQLFVIFRYIYNATTHIIYREVKQDYSNTLEVVDTDGNLPQRNHLISEMASPSRNGSGPGPGDPLFAKQKHHHRRAFEYISKALKIDEENEGELRRDNFDFSLFSIFK